MFFEDGLYLEYAKDHFEAVSNGKYRQKIFRSFLKRFSLSGSLMY